MSAHPKGTATPTTEKIHVELPNLSVVKNVTTTVAVVTVTSESTVLSVGSGPLEVPTLPSKGSSTVPSKVTTPSPEVGTVPPEEGISTGSTVNVPLGPEVLAASVESVPLGIVNSTESELGITTESIEGVPPEESTATSVENVPLNIVESTDQSASSNITSESIACILPEVSAAVVESAVPLNSTVVESTESTVPMEVTFGSIDSVPSEVVFAAASVESVPLNPTIESTESAPLEVTPETSAAFAESTVTLNIPPTLGTTSSSTVSPTPLELAAASVAPTESSPLAAVGSPEILPPEAASEVTECDRPESVVESTEVVVPPDVANSSTGTAPSEVTIACPLKPKQKVTIGSTDNINRPQSTTASNAVAPSPAQTEPSRLTSGPDQALITKARDDADDLHRAFKGLSCDATTIVNILSKRSATHRTLIREEYKAKFCEDFDHRLSRELQFKPKLQRAVLLWMNEPARRDAELVKHGLSIVHMNVAIEVICSRTPSQIEQLKEAYQTMFGVDILEDIKSHAHFDHKKLLLSFAGNPRSEGLEVDEMKVDEDAKVIFKDGEWKLGTNEETFIRVLSERSSAHLAALNSAYQTMYVNSLKKAVKKETSFKFKLGLLTILQCAENRGKYFAKALHEAMKGVGTKDETLTRIIVSRAEVDIQQIKIEYRKKYGKELSDDVHSDTSGHYRAFLLSLLNHKVA